MDIVLSSASHHALLFAYITREVVMAFGADGEEAIAVAVGRYGRQRGRRMAMRARIDSNPCNAITYDMYGEWECFPGQVECLSSAEEHRFMLRYKRCPWHTEWKHFDLLDYGRHYCSSVDAAILEGFGIADGGLICNRVDGDASCDLVFTGECYTPEAYREGEIQKHLLGESAKMPWEYHVGHLYQCLRNVVERRFGQEGTRAIKRGLKSYQDQFGESAKKLVLEYADLDYEALPAYRSYKTPPED